MMRENNVIRLGICAMSKKSGSAPMREIVRRLNLIEFIRVIIFDEPMILTQPVETWPICECLISFFSNSSASSTKSSYVLFNLLFLPNSSICNDHSPSSSVFRKVCWPHLRASREQLSVCDKQGGMKSYFFLGEWRGVLKWWAVLTRGLVNLWFGV